MTLGAVSYHLDHPFVQLYRYLWHLFKHLAHDGLSDRLVRLAFASNAIDCGERAFSAVLAKTRQYVPVTSEQQFANRDRSRLGYHWRNH